MKGNCIGSWIRCRKNRCRRVRIRDKAWDFNNENAHLIFFQRIEILNLIDRIDDSNICGRFKILATTIDVKGNILVNLGVMTLKGNEGKIALDNNQDMVLR